MNITWQAVTQLLNMYSIPVLITVAVMISVWKLSAWKTNVDGKLDVLDEMVRKVNEIYSVIVQNHNRLVAKSDSPIRLTDYGMELAEKINADAIVDIYTDDMQQETQELNAYEIQEYCFNYCKNDLVDDIKREHPLHFEKMSSIAYDEGIDMEKLTRVIGIKLRDKVLFRANMTQAQVDESAADGK